MGFKCFALEPQWRPDKFDFCSILLDMSASFDALVGAVVPSELEAAVKDILVTIGLVDTMASQAWDRCGRMVAVVVWLSFVVVSSSVVMQNSKEPPHDLTSDFISGDCRVIIRVSLRL